jgi:hypothetical protein
VWNKNICLSWKETKEYFGLLGLPTPKVFYEGKYDEDKIKSLKIDYDKEEGYVIRNINSFSYSEFKYNVFKFVRANHVQTKHWKTMTIVPNKLKS